jgi:hypothetical protein
MSEMFQTSGPIVDDRIVQGEAELALHRSDSVAVSFSGGSTALKQTTRAPSNLD